MNFQQLKYFTVLCDKGSFGKAADSLFITQQGLSMAISNLEAEFSCQFFQRTPKGVILTEDGKFFLIRANRILKDLEECWDYFEGREEKLDAIKVAGCQGVLSEFGADKVREFEEKYTGSKVFIREFKDRLVDNEVLSENAELGFGLEPMDASQFECHRVLQRPLVLLMHETNPLAKYEKIPTKIMKDLQLIVVDEDFKSADFFIDECRRQGVAVVPKFRVGEITAVHRLVRQNAGVVGLTVGSVADSLSTPETVYRPFESPAFTWNVDIFKKKNQVLSRGSRIFFEYIQRKMADDDNMKIAPDKIMEQALT